MHARSDPIPAAPTDLSVLIHGPRDDALSVLAVGLAHRAGLPFGWAEFADPASQIDTTLRHRLAELAASSRVEAVAAGALQSANGIEGPVSRLIQPGTLTPELEERLEGFLRFPSLVQRLASEIGSSRGHMAILLTGLQAVPEGMLAVTLERAALHEALHREGISLVGTYRGVPPKRLLEAFDQILRIDERPNRPWADATVSVERGVRGLPLPSAEILRGLGRELRLDLSNSEPR